MNDSDKHTGSLLIGRNGTPLYGLLQVSLQILDLGEVKGSRKHSSLLRNGNNYDRKEFCISGSQEVIFLMHLQSTVKDAPF